jgi:hypothetical protein
VTTCKVLRARAHHSIGNGNRLESIQPNRWENRKGLVDGATPVAEVGIGQSVNGWGRCNNMHLVVAVQLAADLKGAKVAEGVDILDSNLVVVLGQREVQASPRATRGKLDAVINEDGLAMVGLIRSYSSVSSALYRL